MKKKIYAFDFDGTLTHGDTLLLFIRHVHGTLRTVAGFALYSPLLVLMKLHLYPNYKAKQRVFAHFFKGMDEARFNAYCLDFARCNAQVIRPQARQYMASIIHKADLILVVSASIDNWVLPFVEDYLATPASMQRVRVLGTKIEVKNGMLTGRFSTPNCYGSEKVERMKPLVGDRSLCHITAFGDSRGDKEMLDYADDSHFRPFRK